MKYDIHRSLRSVYDIKYYVAFCAKYRRMALYDNIAERCIEVIRKVCSANYVDVISGNASPDHVHMLVSVSSHLSISKIIQYIKGRISRKLQGKFQGLRKRYWRQHLWTRGYFVATSVHLSAKEVQKYIEKQ